MSGLRRSAMYPPRQASGSTSRSISSAVALAMSASSFISARSTSRPKWPARAASRLVPMGSG